MYTTLLFLHFVGLALGLGTSFANLTMGLAMRDLPPAERMQLFMRIAPLGKNGSIGLTLLIVTGLAMMTLRGFGATFAWGGPALHAKLTLVVILAGAFGYLQTLLKRVRLAGGGPDMAKIPVVGRTMLVLSLGIVAAAVIAFH